MDPSQAVGVANSSIVPANRFSASSEYDTGRYKASNARLKGVWGWGPTNSDTDTGHLQIDLGTVYTIYAIATQGNGGTDRKGGGGDDEWVKMYKLKILSVKGVWSFYKEGSTVQVSLLVSSGKCALCNVLRETLLMIQNRKYDRLLLKMSNEL